MDWSPRPGPSNVFPPQTSKYTLPVLDKLQSKKRAFFSFFFSFLTTSPTCRAFRNFGVSRRGTTPLQADVGYFPLVASCRLLRHAADNTWERSQTTLSSATTEAEARAKRTFRRGPRLMSSAVVTTAASPTSPDTSATDRFVSMINL